VAIDFITVAYDGGTSWRRWGALSVGEELEVLTSAIVDICIISMFEGDPVCWQQHGGQQHGL